MILDLLAPIPLPQLAAFLAAGLALNLAPGQDVLFATACGVQDGPRAGALAGLGVGLGGLVHVLAASLGLGTIAAAHPQLLEAVKLVGAGYLLWLAWQAWTATGTGHGHAQARRPWAILRTGTLTNLLNPKVILFLLAFLPQFTDPAWGPVWRQMLALGLMFAATGTLVTMGYGIAAGVARRALRSRMGLLNRLAAVIFAGLALRLVAR